MPSLSIIVPHGGAAEPFEDTLVSVLQNRPPDSEVVVVTAGEYDDPYGLADELSFIAAPAGADLVEIINLGVSAGRGEIVHVIQCGLTVEEGWTDAARAHFEKGRVAAVAPAVRLAEGTVALTGVCAGFTGRRLENVTSELQADGFASHAQGPTLLAGFWRKSAWDRAGGLDAMLGQRYADLDLAMSLHALGYQCVTEPRSQLVQRSACDTNAAGWRDGRSAESLFWKHAAHAHRGAFAMHAVGLAAEFISALPRPRRMIEFLGRITVLGSRAWRLPRSSEAIHPPQSAGTASSEPVRRRDGANLLSERERRNAPRNAVQPY